MLKYTFIFLCAVAFSECTSPHSNKIHNQEQRANWRIFPTSTVLNKKKDFVISGKHIHTAEIITGKSVILERLPTNGNGKILKVLITIDTLDSNDPVDKLGERIIQIVKQEKEEQLILKILDEEIPQEWEK